MVGRDVGEHARVVRLVADALEHDPAPGRLQDRDVDVVALQDLRGAARPGPVALFDHPLVDEDAVGGRRADVAAGQDEDVGDQPGDRALPVRAADAHDRGPPVRVADPGRRRPASAVAMAPVCRSSRRVCAPVSVARRAGETSRSARAKAASAMARPRSTTPSARSRSSARARRSGGRPARPCRRDGRSGAGGPRPRSRRRRRASRCRHRGTQADPGVGAGSRWPYQVRRRPTATSSLTTGASR